MPSQHWLDELAKKHAPPTPPPQTITVPAPSPPPPERPWQPFDFKRIQPLALAEIVAISAAAAFAAMFVALVIVALLAGK